MVKILGITLIWATVLSAQLISYSTPFAEKINADQLARADGLIEQSIEEGTIPGAVLLVMRDSKIVYEKAYGYKQLVPEKVKMETTTIFDMASVTKPVATGTSVMLLIEQGKLRLLDRVKDFIPAFKPWQSDSSSGVEHIRLIHLLTHTSGLPPYAPVEELKEKYGSPAPDSLIQHIAIVKRHHAPGTYFKYSCLNFITLQKIVEVVSGQSLMDFSAKNIFIPLGMKNTTYKPAEDLLEHCAPTEQLDNELLTGKVHDPLAREMMDCISGNAGLFSTAKDLAVFSAMMLNNGKYNNRQILSPAAVKTMTRITPGYEKFGRALGWDISSAYSSNKGDLFGPSAYGHTGYTGTSLVIDPDSKTALILLTNRVHPDDKGSVVRLRSLVANVVAGAIRE